VRIGSTLGRYKIQQQLGSGGMGEVYLADDPTLGRSVALKILPADLATDPDRRARFESEARALAALNHPNIVTIHSIEHENDVHFITMEYVAGKTLASLIPSRGMPIRQFLEITLPLVEAVSAAHQQRVTHRDLKPDNVMLGDEGRVKVLDFGLAKPMPGLGDDTMETAYALRSAKTGVGQIVGTAAYMSPEQAEGKPVDNRSDVFSLGIMFHEMVTGQRPFVGDTHASIVSSILRDSPPPITDVHPAHPVGLAKIVKRCLAKDPSRRYQTALDLRNALEELKEELDSGAPVAVAARPPPRKRSPLLAGTIGLTVVVLAAVVYWLRPSPEGGARSEAVGEVAFSQLTYAPGPELFPSLSPDGRMIVYASGTGVDLDIYSQRVAGQNPINLTPDSPVDDSQPAFGPDGEHIAFRSERDGGGIFVMGATGESVRRLLDFGYHPAWSPDGRQILYVTQSVGDPALRFTTSELWVVTIATGERRLLTEGDAVQPSWSPNGYRIAYWGRNASSPAGDIWTLSAAGGEPVAVTSEPALDWNPVWAPDGRHLYFSSNRGGSMSLWRVAIDERSGKTLGRAEPLTTGGGAASQHITVSKDGRRIAYVSQVETTNLQKVTFDPAAGTTQGAVESITRGSRTVAQPDASPDGQLLAFNSAGRQEDIWVVQTDGNGLGQLTDDAFKDRAARWSPDGRRIAFYSDRTGQLEIWAINRDGSGLQQLTRSPGAHYPVWSPDGALMAYSTHSPNGAFLFATGKPWNEQRSQPLPTMPDAAETFEIWSWSPDGRRLAGQKHLADLSHVGIGVHEIGSQRIEWLTDFGEWPVWMNDSRRLLFSHQGKLFMTDSVSGEPREIMALPQKSLGSVGLSADNRTIYLTSMAAEADVWMITAE
jgi:Tol biopolymer transport system component/predicted Ser/Thr protein kinase